MQINIKKEKNGEESVPFYELPIVTDPDMESKNSAAIFPDKIVCHPDLEETVREGMRLIRERNENPE